MPPHLRLLQAPGGAAPSAEVLSASKSGQRSGNAIPVVLGVRAAGATGVADALEADIDGVAVTPEALSAVGRACFDLPEVR